MQRVNSGESLGVFFHASTCGHCHTARDAIHQVLGDIPLTVYGINVGYDMDLALAVGAEATPTLVLFADGKPLSKLEGARSPEVYEQFLTTGGGGDEEGDEEESGDSSGQQNGEE